MTRLTDLYRKAEELDIRVIQFPMASLRAVSTPDNFIGIDPDKLEDREELVCLAHEMGHCATGSFYTSDATMLDRTRQEQRADRWAIRQLVPLEELKNLLRSGVDRWDEAAEHFQVTEEFMRKAVAFYRDARDQL
ncbi:MAG: ImmA/IrrE family metallo-endopeptidase [Clostridia bacterium]|jgi:Zn-dependent peptidase ImmA (M78 family)|nr:ImmA/IrrE family metallo-endopeptidase [Clostridia bacterium]